MHEIVFNEFEKICGKFKITGSVLEVGATPDDSSLLNMGSLKNASKKIGINLDGPYTYKDYKILKCNSNEMKDFKDGQFDVVLCNALIEHDKFFWKTIVEIKRVTSSGGLIVIGSPGFCDISLKQHVRANLLKMLFLSRFINLDFLRDSTLTMNVHNFPGDYYRFSPQAFKEVIFEGLKDVEVRTVMIPPRVIGSGIKP